MITKLHVQEMLGLFRIYIDGHYFLDSDVEMAASLNMRTSEYQVILLLNGARYFKKYDTIFFQKYEDAMQAKDEIESVLLIKKLSR